MGKQTNNKLRYNPIQLWRIDSNEFERKGPNAPMDQFESAEEFDPAKHNGFSGKCAYSYGKGQAIFTGIQFHNHGKFETGEHMSSSHFNAVTLGERIYKDITGKSLQKIEERCLAGFISIDTENSIISIHGSSDIYDPFQLHQQDQESKSHLKKILEDYARSQYSKKGFRKEPIIVHDLIGDYELLCDKSGKVDLSDWGILRI